jgi:hypothetical protein
MVVEIRVDASEIALIRSWNRQAVPGQGWGAVIRIGILF